MLEQHQSWIAAEPSSRTLTHRSKRRPGLIILGLLLVFIGGWLMLTAIEAARLRMLTCSWTDQEVTCQGKLVWLGVVLREAAVTAEQAVVFAASVDEADRAAAYLKTPADESLIIRAGGDFDRLSWGLIGSILVAVGLFLAVSGYRIIVRPAHGGTVSGLAFSPDGSRLASAGLDKVVHLWPTEDDACLTLNGQHGPLVGCAFTPDGAGLVTASWDRVVSLWRVSDGTLLNRWQVDGDPFVCLTLSPAGEMLACGGSEGQIRLWRLADSTLMQTLDGHQGRVEDLAFSADGQILVSASADRSVRLWQVTDGLTLHKLEHPEGVTCAAIAPDGQTVTSGSTDSLIRLWSVESGILERSLEGHSHWVRRLRYAPDGQTLISASTDQTIRLWSLENGALIRTLHEHQSEVTALAMSPDGRWLASGSADQTVKLWPLTRDREEIDLA